MNTSQKEYFLALAVYHSSCHQNCSLWRQHRVRCDALFSVFAKTSHTLEQEDEAGTRSIIPQCIYCVKTSHGDHFDDRLIKA